MCVLALEIEEQIEETKVTLKKAFPVDFKLLKSEKQLSNGQFKPIYEYRFGVPFWLKSMVTNEIENHCTIFSKETNKEDFADWLRLGMVYIPENLK